MIDMKKDMTTYQRRKEKKIDLNNTQRLKETDIYIYMCMYP